MKALIVDDSLIIGERLETMLSEIPEIETVSQAKTESEAMELLHRLNPEVLLLDIQMRGGNGIDLLRKVKNERPSPLVVVFTDLSDTRSRKKCMDAGADFFFDKSTDFDKLTEVLSEEPRASARGSSKEKP